MAFFDIIIPLYNKEEFIQQTLQSVFNQDFKDFNVLIVNDASTDGGISASTYLKQPNVNIITHDVNKGLSAARNTGIKNSTADYLVFLDADDIWLPDFLTKINHLIEQFPTADIFATGFCTRLENGTMIYNQHPLDDELKGQNFIIEDFFETNRQHALYNYSSVAFKKELFNKVGMFDENISYAEDVEFNIRANWHGTLAYNYTPSSYYLLSDNQITKGSIKGKTIMNFDKFKEWESESISLKRYLDFKRYTMGMRFKEAKMYSEYNAILNNIDFKNLSISQQFLLKSPVAISNGLKQIKNSLLKFGFQWTTFR